MGEYTYSLWGNYIAYYERRNIENEELSSMYYGGYDSSCYPVGYGGYGGYGGVRSGFALIVVLFVLLIIIGACWCYPK